MKTITLTDIEAKSLYRTAPDSLKESLESLYGKKFFSQKITDRIKTFEDACNELNVDPNSILNGALSADELAYRKLKIIIQVLNEGWKPDWTDSEEYKYYPWFDLSCSSGLVYYYCDDWYAFTNAGSRLCFKSRELAEYAGKQFTQIYKDFMLL